MHDTRYGNPFDAVATKAGSTRYLEAKGTETDGASVIVTAGEVEWARQHKGECVLGIVSGIRFVGDELDVGSGELTLHVWDPDTGVLTAKSYSWRPSP